MLPRKLVIRLLLSLLAVGIVAAIVYGLCGLIVLQAGMGGPDPASGHVFIYESTGRSGRVQVFYVTHGFHLTSMITGYIAAICLGSLLAAGLFLLFGDTARLFIPASYERANLELARYRLLAGSNGVTADGLRYVSAWRDLNRRKSRMLCLIALIIVPGLIELPRQWAWMATLAWLAAAVVLRSWRRAFRCPRCGEPFEGKRWRRSIPTFCVYCGLPRDSYSTTAVSPDFAEWKLWNPNF